MGRVKNWPRRLDETIDAWRDVPFVWGESDCVNFCIDVEKAMYGVSKVEAAIGGYKTKKGAAKQIAKFSKKGILVILDDIFTSIPIKTAGRGDLGVTHTPDGPAVGIFTGGAFVGMGAGGLQFLKHNDAFLAWRL